jgi:hypothetical protein
MVLCSNQYAPSYLSACVYVLAVSRRYNADEQCDNNYVPSHFLIFKFAKVPSNIEKAPTQKGETGFCSIKTTRKGNTLSTRKMLLGTIKIPLSRFFFEKSN